MEPTLSSRKVQTPAGRGFSSGSVEDEVSFPSDQDIQKEILKDRKVHLEQRLEHVRQVWDRLDAPAALARMVAIIPALGFGALFVGLFVPGLFTWMVALGLSAANENEKFNFNDAVQVIIFAPLTIAVGLLEFTLIGKGKFNFEDFFRIKPKNEAVQNEAKPILQRKPRIEIPKLLDVQNEIENLKEEIKSLEAIEKHLQTKIDRLDPAVAFSRALSIVPLVLSGAIAVPFFIAIGLPGAIIGALIGWEEELTSTTKVPFKRKKMDSDETEEIFVDTHKVGLIEARVDQAMGIAALPFAAASVLWEFMWSGKTRSLDDVMPLAWQLGNAQEKLKAAQGPPSKEMTIGSSSTSKAVRVINYLFDQGRYWETLAEVENKPEYYQKAIRYYKAANHEFISEAHRKLWEKDYSLLSTITQMRVNSLLGLSEEEYQAFMQTLSDNLSFVKAKLFLQKKAKKAEKKAIDHILGANRTAITAALKGSPQEGLEEALSSSVNLQNPKLRFAKVKEKMLEQVDSSDTETWRSFLSDHKKELIKYVNQEIDRDTAVQSLNDSLDSNEWEKSREKIKNDLETLMNLLDKTEKNSLEVQYFLNVFQNRQGLPMLKQLPSALFAIARCHQRLRDKEAANKYVETLRNLNQRNAEMLVKRAFVEFPVKKLDETDSGQTESESPSSI